MLCKHGLICISGLKFDIRNLTYAKHAKRRICSSLRSKRFRRVFSARSRHFSLFRTFLRSPQVLHVQKAKNASNLRKALRKRLLRRLHLQESMFSRFLACSAYSRINTVPQFFFLCFRTGLKYFYPTNNSAWK